MLLIFSPFHCHILFLSLNHSLALALSPTLALSVSVSLSLSLPLSVSVTSSLSLSLSLALSLPSPSLQVLSSHLMHSSLPGLTRLEQMFLVALADTVATTSAEVTSSANQQYTGQYVHDDITTDKLAVGRFSHNQTGWRDFYELLLTK